jgi:membrane protein involved in colicin uptake
LRQAREKARRDKAEAEAKAKLAIQQREQDAARAKAEQEAAARRRAEERQARQAVPQPVPAAPPPKLQTVDEICAGRNLISLGICENRECASPAHANEATCKRIYEREERRKFN